MAFEYLSNEPLDKALEGFLKALEERGFAPRTDMVPVGEALGRITAEPLYAAISAPHYHACAMDGIALAANVTFGATATTPVIVQPEDYVVVDTGDPVPDGCDAVVMIEDVVYGEGSSIDDLGTCPVILHAAIAPWGNVRQIGEDICAGEMLLTSNVRIEPAAMGAMLAAGVQQVAVIAKPRVGVIPTGDEVVAPSANPKPGDVMEFNSTIFSGMAQTPSPIRLFPTSPIWCAMLSQKRLLNATSCCSTRGRRLVETITRRVRLPQWARCFTTASP